MEDPEAIFQMGRLLCDVGDSRKGWNTCSRAVRGVLRATTLSTGAEFDWHSR